MTFLPTPAVHRANAPDTTKQLTNVSYIKHTDLVP